MERDVKIVPFKGMLAELLCAVALFVAGCTSIPPAQVSAFGKGVDAVKLQTDTAFATVNQMATEDSVEFALTQPTLTEENVAVVLKSEDIAKWDRAFASIDDYVANLNLLLSPDRANEFSTATEGLATELAKLDAKALPSPGVATGFNELGRLLIQAKAESDAQRVAREVDPAMQDIFSSMASTIGETNEDGIRGTVWSHWKLRMAAQKQMFLAAKGDAKRAVVEGFINLRNRRDAEEMQLSSLRQSILDLGVAHAALARGSNTDLDSAISRIQQELDATKAFYEHFVALKPKAEGN